MSVSHDSSRPPDSGLPSGLPGSRRSFLTGALVSGGVLAVAGYLPASAQAASALDDCYDGLAAFVMPGNDRFSRQQRLATAQAGGVEAGAGRIIQKTLNDGVSVGAAGRAYPLPGAAGIAVLLKNFALQVSPLSAAGPLAHAFANLRFAEKREVLQRVDATPLLEDSPLAYVGGTLTTIAALAAWGEGNAYNQQTRQLTRRPVGYARSNYQGVRNGEIDFLGFYQDRTEVQG